MLTGLSFLRTMIFKNILCTTTLAYLCSLIMLSNKKNMKAKNMPHAFFKLYTIYHIYHEKNVDIFYSY